MNNLHRELAPVSPPPGPTSRTEAKRTFERHAAARKAVDVTGPDGLTLAGLGTGHVRAIDAPARRRRRRRCATGGPSSSCGCRSRFPALEIDSVERGALDPDWQPVKDAAKKIAFAEDRAVFDGYAAAQITGCAGVVQHRAGAARRGARLPGRRQPRR
jgi:uncharacterized linocin/CFP29 family protein